MTDSGEDIAISYDCLPKIGGAHMWLYEVYRRWPTPVSIFTSEYSHDAATCARAHFDLRSTTQAYAAIYDRLAPV